MINSHKDLIVWQKSFLLAKDIYKITRKLPQTEIYGITSQMQRCAISIPSNIAEGYGRGHRAEYIQFLRIAFGSGSELETQLLLCKDLYPNFEYNESIDLLNEILRMLNVLMHKLSPKP